MSHSDSLRDVPNVNSKEFEDYLEKYGLDKNMKNLFDTKTKVNTTSNKNPDISEESQTNTPDTPIGEKIIDTIENWFMKNPGPGFLIIMCGSAFICYKLTASLLAQGTYKGLMKFYKHIY